MDKGRNYACYLFAFANFRDSKRRFIPTFSEIDEIKLVIASVIPSEGLLLLGLLLEEVAYLLADAVAVGH